jgi:hypothetical protein
MGWHIRGEMGGVWAHPIKLLEGYCFALDGQWILQASKFTSGAGYVQMQLPKTDGLNVTRTEFSPDGSPVVLVGLTLENPNSTSKSVKLTMDARSAIAAAVPVANSRSVPAAAALSEMVESRSNVIPRSRRCRARPAP